MSHLFAIDVHTHLGAVSAFRPRFGTPEEMIALMDVTHTQLSVVIPMALLTAQFELGYRETITMIEEYPDRLRAYTVFDPNWPDVSLRLVERHLEHSGFVGVKIHPTIHGVDPTDGRYSEFWAFADEREAVVLTHSWSPDPAKPTQNLAVPDRFAAILESFPRMKLILGHCGGRDVGRRLAVEMMQRYANCYADLSGDDWPCGELEWLMTQAPRDRVLYGTDAVWIEPRYVFGHVLRARISAEDRMAIFRENALKLFGPRLQIPLQRS